MRHSTETAEQHKTVHKNRPTKKSHGMIVISFPAIRNPGLAFIGAQLLSLGKVVEEILLKQL